MCSDWVAQDSASGPSDMWPQMATSSKPFHRYQTKPFHRYQTKPFHRYQTKPFHRYQTKPFHRYQTKPFHRYKTHCCGSGSTRIYFIWKDLDPLHETMKHIQKEADPYLSLIIKRSSYHLKNHFFFVKRNNKLLNNKNKIKVEYYILFWKNEEKK